MLLTEKGLPSHSRRGEWSLRIYASEDGRGAWKNIVVDATEEFYLRAIQHFGDDNEWPCQQAIEAEVVQEEDN